jgi:hypothetical protein
MADEFAGVISATPTDQACFMHALWAGLVTKRPRTSRHVGEASKSDRTAPGCAVPGYRFEPNAPPSKLSPSERRASPLFRRCSVIGAMLCFESYTQSGLLNATASDPL